MRFFISSDTENQHENAQSIYYFIFAAASISICFWLINIVFYWPKIAPGVPNNSLFDDSFMFIRYAKNFLAGHGFSWNASDGKAYGITSTAYLLLITFLRYISKLQDWQVLVFSSFLFTCLAFWSLVVLIRSIKFRSGETAFLLVLLLTISSSFSYSWKYHAFTGMETMMSLFSNTLLIISVIKFSQKREVLQGFAAATCGYFTYLVRPDNGIYAILFPALFLFFSDKKSRWRLMTVPVCISVLLAADYYIKPLFLGSPLPFAFYSKQKGFFKLHLAQNLSVINLAYFLKDCSLPYLLIIAAFFNKKNKYAILSSLIPVFLTFAYFSTLNQFMGNYGRYYLPSLPFFIFSVAYALSLEEFGSIEFIGNNLKRGIILIVLIIITGQEGLFSSLAGIEQRFTAGQSIFNGKRYTSDSLFPRDNQEKQTEALPSFTRFAKQLPEGTVLTATEHGYLSAMALNTEIIDLTGLHDLNIVRNGLTIQYLQSRDPDIIWLPNHNYISELNLILDSPYFRNNFDFYPRLYGFGIAIRRSSPNYNLIKSIFYKTIEKEFSISDPEQFRVDLDLLQAKKSTL